MTRGSAYCFYIKDNIVWIKYGDEWNGGMSNTDTGSELLEKMLDLKDHLNFSFMVYEFNKENHNYNDFKLGTMPLHKYLNVKKPYLFDPLGGNLPITIDLSVDYYAIWFSDYNYFINLSSMPIIIYGEIDEVKTKSSLEPGSIIVTNYQEIMYISGHCIR